MQLRILQRKPRTCFDPCSPRPSREPKNRSQNQAGKIFGVTQPRVTDLLRGKVDLFSLDTLVNMLAAAGLKVQMQVAPAA